MYFQVCSYSAYPQHSGERYRTNGPLVFEYHIFEGIYRFSQLGAYFVADRNSSLSIVHHAEMFEPLS